MARSKRKDPKLYSPDPGPWSLDWSEIDSDGPYAWPQEDSDQFRELSHFLSKLNRLSLDKIFSLERNYNQGNAFHAISPENLSPEASARWQELFDERNLDSIDSLDADFVSVTFCLDFNSDPRRIILRYYPKSRLLRPLWWDQLHRVSGSSGKANDYGRCRGNNCYHSSLF